MLTDLSEVHAPISHFLDQPEGPQQREKYLLTEKQLAGFHENGYVAGIQVLNDRQRLGPQVDDRANERLLEVPLPERQENGVILAPSTATIRIQE